MEKYVLIVAGGQGNRMNSEIPKQFIPVAEKPILMHTINTFIHHDPSFHVVLVLPPHHIKLWKAMCKSFNFGVDHSVAKGGQERFYSVKNGLKLIPNDSLVLIHDGVRPLVSDETIAAVIFKATSNGNAIPCVGISDSMRKVNGENSKIVDRAEYKSIQTPQGFHSNLIKDAYNRKYRQSFTDDASVLESAGHKINLVEGNYANIKITRPVDIKVAEALILSDIRLKY